MDYSKQSQNIQKFDNIFGERLVEHCGPINQLIVRDDISKNIWDNIPDAVIDIINSGCPFWKADDESAGQVVQCLNKYYDFTEWTNDEFEYALRIINFICCVQIADYSGFLPQNNDGDAIIPEAWFKVLLEG